MDTRTVPGVGFYAEGQRCHDCGRVVYRVEEFDHSGRGRILVCEQCAFRLGRDPLVRPLR